MGYPALATGGLGPIPYSSKVGMLGAIYLALVRERGFAYTSVAAGGWALGIFLPPEVAEVPFLQHEVLGSCSLLC